MKKQTAIRWLGYELNTNLFYDISPELWEKVNELFKQAIEKEKQQIDKAYASGANDRLNNRLCDYYNENYTQ